MKLGYQTNTWGGVVGHPAGVTSIKDSYYLANGSTEEALTDIASAGYQGFELFDGNLMQFADKKEEIKALMDSLKLSLIGVYSGGNFIFDEILDEELAKIEKAAKLAAEFGAEHLVIGGGAIRSTGILESDYEKLGQALNKVIAIAEENGLVASYHPHLGSLGETPEQVDKIAQYTSINFCPDTAHIEAGGGDPIEFITKYQDRIKYVHLKDLQDGEFLPLGKGKQNLAGIIEALQSIQYDGWVTVELDSYPDPKLGAQMSYDYLIKNYK
ncbi:sugar phosphate isomerase/epimerase [Alkalihalobacillus sp. BA299]|uniref:sugar phosphate isomerase/epimerase family protein n=1 Tax=Alkalihalobacillus sp. BA299 TaxID=2815938 RepID=UPI001ADCCC92|nr:sugar phosphate isomerase/epimerase [Alkalihalobacillus sp. BA299]